MGNKDLFGVINVDFREFQAYEYKYQVPIRNLLPASSEPITFQMNKSSILVTKFFSYYIECYNDTKRKYIKTN